MMESQILISAAGSLPFLTALYGWGIGVIKAIQSIANPALTVLIKAATSLGTEYFYGLIFLNKNVKLQNVRGQLRFELGGNKQDIERFWQDFERRCREHGTTVNEVLLGCVDNNTDQINPYKFFTEYIGRYHYTLITINYKGYPTDVTLDKLPLRRLLPPWSTILIQQNLTIEDTVTLAGSSGDDLNFTNLLTLEGDYAPVTGANIYTSKI